MEGFPNTADHRRIGNSGLMALVCSRRYSLIDLIMSHPFGALMGGLFCVVILPLAILAFLARGKDAPPGW